jgi:uncharacterized protein (DUF433 family)
VAGTRISLDSVVYSFNGGNSPEAIQENFPLLKRAQIYGAIAFYLDHQAEIDEYLDRIEREIEESASHCSRRIRRFGKSWSAARAKMGEPPVKQSS